MTNDKKKTNIRRGVAFVLVISILAVAAIAARDLFLSPADQLQRGRDNLNNGHYAAAERALILAANSGETAVSSTAAFELGELYRKGKPGFPANGAKAALFLEQAAKAGLPMAAYRLALMYDNGDQVVENRSKALFFMNEAAKTGLTDALYALGVWLERGYMGAVDMNKVVALYERAAEQGNKNAMTSLAVIYADGFGTFPANIERSVYWRARLEGNTQEAETVLVAEPIAAASEDMAENSKGE